MRTVWPLLLLLSTAAWAKPWQGIEPGVSKKADVLKKFGEPTKVVPSDAKEIMAYMGPQTIKGTQQAQFRVDAATQTVERIDVFPGPQIDKDMVEQAYGKECPPGSVHTPSCYVKRLGDNFKTYFTYTGLGLSIFFDKDGKVVESFIFTPAKPAPGAAKTGTK